jgi:hypothetical protein
MEFNPFGVKTKNDLPWANEQPRERRNGGYAGGVGRGRVFAFTR